MAASLSGVQLSESEKRYLVDGCADDCRIDGRTREEFRQYTLIAGCEIREEEDGGSSQYHPPPSPPLILSNGSARLILSSSGTAATHILCSVKVELGRPSERHPNRGTLQIHVEDNGQTGSGGQSRKKSQEERNYLQSIISELLANNILDLEALCVIPNHYAFTVNVDVEVLSGTAGNLVDACCHTIRAALQNTLLPHIIPSASASGATVVDDSGMGIIKEQQQPQTATADLILESDIRQAKIPVGVEKAPIVVTVTVCQRLDTSSNNNSFLLLLDASLEEEACSYCQVHVAVDPPPPPDGDASASAEPTICALRKTGAGSLPWALLPDITALAFAGVPKAMESYQIAKKLTQQSQQQSFLQEQIAIQ